MAIVPMHTKASSPKPSSRDASSSCGEPNDSIRSISQEESGLELYRVVLCVAFADC